MHSNVGRALPYFNPIKVQLKLARLLPFASGTPFQFHKGTIKTAWTVRSCFFSPSFQFHKGTIKTTRSLNLLYIYIYFNSIKVQLKPGLHHNELVVPWFQFHKGTIKTCEPHRSRTRLKNFNSIKVQLKLRNPQYFAHAIIISIP